MAAFTVKKKNPLVLKPQGEAAASDAEVPGAVTTFAPPDFSAAQRPASYLVPGIASILSVLFVAALLLFQWLELQEYQKPPVAFPQPGAAAAP